MKLFVRIAACVALALVVLLAGVALYLEFFFDANAYKPKLSAAAREATGRELQIDGDLGLRLLPSPQVRAGAARLLDRPDFDGSALVEIASAQASFELLPLLRRQVQIEDLKIEGLRLALRRKSGGEDNWSDLMSAKKKDKSASGDDKAVSVENLRLEDARLALKDEASGRDWVLSAATLSAGGWGHSSETPLELNGKLASKAARLEGTLSARGQTRIDLANGRFGARDLTLEFEGKGPAGPIKAELSGEAALDSQAETLSAKVAAKLLDLNVQAQFYGQGLRSKPRFEGQFAFAEFNPRKLLQHLGKPAPDTRDSSALTRAKFEMRVQGQDSRLTVEPIAAQLDTSNISGRITLADYANPRIAFRLNVDQIDLDRYRPPEPSPPSLEDNAISKLSKDSLREAGYTLSGEILFGVLILARERDENYRLVIEAGS